MPSSSLRLVGVVGQVLVEERRPVKHGPCSRGERCLPFVQGCSKPVAASRAAQFFDDRLDAREPVVPLAEESDHSGVSDVVCRIRSVSPTGLAFGRKESCCLPNTEGGGADAEPVGEFPDG